MNKEAKLNQFLSGDDKTRIMKLTDSIPTNVLSAAKIVARKEFRLGGQFGDQTAKGNVCRVMSYLNIGYFDISDIVFDYEPEDGSLYASGNDLIDQIIHFDVDPKTGDLLLTEETLPINATFSISNEGYLVADINK